MQFFSKKLNKYLVFFYNIKKFSKTKRKNMKNLKIYYFFNHGEFEFSLESDNPDNAIKDYLNDETTSKQFDFLIEYDKKSGAYVTFRTDFFKKYFEKN